MPKGRIENLRPFTSQQDREAARINGRKGGIIWGRMRRERREKQERERAIKLLRPWEEYLNNSTFGRLRYKHQLFLYAFVSCGNAAKAARDAGYSTRWAKNIGYRLLRRADVRDGLTCLYAYALKSTDRAMYPGIIGEVGEL